MPLDMRDNVLFMRLPTPYVTHQTDRCPQRCPHVWKAALTLADADPYTRWLYAAARSGRLFPLVYASLCDLARLACR